MSRSDQKHSGFQIRDAERRGGDRAVRPPVPQPFKLRHEVAHHRDALGSDAARVRLEQRGGRLDEHPRHRARLHQPKHLLELGRDGILRPTLAPAPLQLGVHHGRDEQIHVVRQLLDLARLPGLADALEPRGEHFPRRRLGLRLERDLVSGLRQAVIQSAAPAEQARDFQTTGGVRLILDFVLSQRGGNE